MARMGGRGPSMPPMLELMGLPIAPLRLPVPLSLVVRVPIMRCVWVAIPLALAAVSVSAAQHHRRYSAPSCQPTCEAPTCEAPTCEAPPPRAPEQPPPVYAAPPGMFQQPPA